MTLFPPPTAEASRIEGLADGGAVWRTAFAGGLRPDPVMSVDEWANKHRRLPVESSPFPGQWRTDRAPYLREPMECLSPSHPCKRVTVRKGAQLGFTDIGINFLFTIIDVFQGPAMLVAPTVDLGKAYNREKLEPAIRATARIAARVHTQRSRATDGSTTLYKRFPGGFLVITGANSSAGLQMRSIRFLLKEEVSEWPFDVDGRGDPDDMSENRTDAFADDCKIYVPSTPGIEGNCRITKAYLESDQRKYFVPCPGCGHRQVLVWDRLKWREEFPHEAAYECESCEMPIPHHAKREMLAAGAWIATKPGPGREPGFDIGQIYSPFLTWDDLVDKWLKARGDPRKEKVFSQQVKGLPWKEAGDAPEAQLLFDRRDGYRMGAIPPGGLVLTVGIDIGKDHFIYEVVAWGIGKTSWSVEAGKISVESTADLENWDVIDELLSKEFPDWQGVLRPIEMAAIDSGYNTHIVYQFCRRRTLTMAVDGRDGASRPPLGLPRKLDISVGGRTIKKGARVWPVGTWTLKAEYYANLRKKPPEDGAEQYQIGYCHFSTDHKLEFFEEATNEVLETTIVRDRERRGWKRLGPNHYLDCRVYAMAAAERLGMSRWQPVDWARLASEREAPAEGAQRDLAALWTSVVPAARRGKEGAAPPKIGPKPDRKKRRRGGGKARGPGA